MARPRRPLTPLERRAKRIEVSGRAADAGWIGDEHAVAAVSGLRPDFRAIVDGLGFTGYIDIVTAAAALMGMNGGYPDRSEWPNPFVPWSQAQRDAAQGQALAVRRFVAVLSDGLIRGGVQLQAVGSDARYSDGYDFAVDQPHLTLLLWLDIPLAGRSGAAIAGDLVAIPTVGWERTGDALSVSDRASEQDVRDGFALRRAWLAGQGRPSIRKPYARGGRRRSPRHQPARDRRREAVAAVLRAHPNVTAAGMRATWEEGAATPGGLLRAGLGWQHWDPPPSEETLRVDLQALRRP